MLQSGLRASLTWASAPMTWRTISASLDSLRRLMTPKTLSIETRIAGKRETSEGSSPCCVSAVGLNVVVVLFSFSFSVLTLFPGITLCCLVARAETISETGLWLTHTHTHTHHSSQSGVLCDEIKDSTPAHWNVEQGSPPLSLGCMWISSHLWIHSHVFFVLFFFLFIQAELLSTQLHSLVCAFYYPLCFYLSLSLVVSPRLFFFLLIRWRCFCFLCN